MGFLDIGVRYLSRPTRPKPKAPAFIADGIRRMAEAGEIDPAMRFVREEDHLIDLAAYEAVLENTALDAYHRGRRDELALNLLVLAVALALPLLLAALLGVGQ